MPRLDKEKLCVCVCVAALVIPWRYHSFKCLAELLHCVSASSYHVCYVVEVFYVSVCRRLQVVYEDDLDADEPAAEDAFAPALSSDEELDDDLDEDDDVDEENEFDVMLADGTADRGDTGNGDENDDDLGSLLSEDD